MTERIQIRYRILVIHHVDLRLEVKLIFSFTYNRRVILCDYISCPADYVIKEKRILTGRDRFAVLIVFESVCLVIRVGIIVIDLSALDRKSVV